MDTRTVNCIQKGKLKIVDKLGSLLPRKKAGGGKKTDKKNPPATPANSFGKEAATTYRKGARAFVIANCGTTA